MNIPFDNLRSDDGCFTIRLPRVPDCFPRPKTPEGCFDPFPTRRELPARKRPVRGAGSAPSSKEHRRPGHRRGR